MTRSRGRRSARARRVAWSAVTTPTPNSEPRTTIAPATLSATRAAAPRRRRSLAPTRPRTERRPPPGRRRGDRLLRPSPLSWAGAGPACPAAPSITPSVRPMAAQSCRAGRPDSAEAAPGADAGRAGGHERVRDLLLEQRGQGRLHLGLGLRIRAGRGGRRRHLAVQLRVAEGEPAEAAGEDPADDDRVHRRPALQPDHPILGLDDEPAGEERDDDREEPDLVRDVAGDRAADEGDPEGENELLGLERRERVVLDAAVLGAAEADRGLDRALRADRTVAGPAAQPGLGLRVAVAVEGVVISDARVRTDARVDRLRFRHLPALPDVVGDGNDRRLSRPRSG